ncbi:MAG: polysaccharide deacetylase family protein [Candidatus Krumholzibacteriota bacterium]|nr:polysaccharide deacetylase family protein [Candidatus Krumholzibacteriota bacterium]
MAEKVENRSIVLVYHAIASESEPSGLSEPGDLSFVVRTADFILHMSYLYDTKIPVATLDGPRAAGSPPGEAPPLVLTFDGGHRSHYTWAQPVLEKYEFPAYFFITTGYIGRDYYLTGEMIRKLHQAGMTIGSHGVSHAFLPDLTPQEIKEELRESRNRLADITGSAIETFSAPGGCIDDRVMDLAREAGYRRVFGSTPGINENPGQDAVLRRFAVKKDWTLDRFTATVGGHPPAGEKMKYRTLRLARKILGNRFYVTVRRTLPWIK